MRAGNCSGNVRNLQNVDILENKVPPPLVAVVSGLAMYGLAQITPALDAGAELRIALAAASVLAGAFFCLAGVVSFRRARTTVNPLKPESATSLVTTGIYRVSRNPMYVGFALFLVAWAGWLAAPWALAGVIAFVLYINRFQIAPEERALAAIFGAEFEHYKAGVRRWL